MNSELKNTARVAGVVIAALCIALAWHVWKIHKLEDELQWKDLQLQQAFGELTADERQTQLHRFDK